MATAAQVRARRLDRAYAAGRRWEGLLDRRAETVRRLKAGGPTQADEPDRVERYQSREAAKQLALLRAGVPTTFLAERKIGPTLDLDDYPPDEPARIAGVPVGRIVEVGATSAALDGFATGFLVGPGLILTNHHVFASADECDGCGIQFAYEMVDGHLNVGPVFPFDTARFFFTDDTLDFTIVAIASRAADGTGVDRFASLRLIPSLGKILVGQSISIIQYPEGGPKKYGVRDNELLVPPAGDDLFIQYTTDTLPGSSGSPAFNKDWEVVGLHHSGVPEIRNGQIMTIRGTPWTSALPDTDIHWIANEGVRISRICDALIAAHVSPSQREAWVGLVQTFQEDFSMLPIVQAQASGTSLVGTASGPAAPVAADGSRGLTVVVNGTANFYVGAATGQGLPATLTVTAGNGAAAGAGATGAVEKKLVFDPNYKTRKGYSERFIKVPVPLPGVATTRLREILKQNGKPLVLKYHHYSLVMNLSRRLQMWSAVNADYTPAKRRMSRDAFGTDTWVPDPRIPGADQIEDQELYDPATKFDRGHIVRREDTAWGESEQEEIFSNSDSFHWTNCTPQHQQFNRAIAGFHGLWGELENHIQSQAKDVGNRMCIFAGPILDLKTDIKHDFGGGAVVVPVRFWKVLFVTERSSTSTPRLRAYGFILDQRGAIAKFGLEKFSVGEFDTFQVRLGEIATAAGVTFDKSLTAADALAGLPHESRRTKLRSIGDVQL